MQKWKTLSRTPMFEYNEKLRIERYEKELPHSRITFERHEIELPDGLIIANWPWIETADFIEVLAMTTDEKFICFRQTKYGLDRISIAPVGGYIKDDETPVQAAQRELLEETGYQAKEWINLGAYRVDPNLGISMGHLFLALSAYHINLPMSDDIEEQQLIFLNQADLTTALSNGEFKVLGWTALVALSLAYINRTSEN